MDEFAAALGMDPVELRLRNYAERDAKRDLPWSSKALRECYRLAAERFGWAGRNPEPRSMRAGRELVGLGMATTLNTALRWPTDASATLFADGSIVVRSATTDMGPGTYTSMTQIAADTLGFPLEDVRFELGDSALPKAAGHGGSTTLASVGNGDWQKTHSCYGFGAVFAEVRVDPDLGTIRVPRIVGAYDTGRVINPRLARSQCIGGMVGGIGMALLEEAAWDPRFGRVMNANLAEYLVPVCADVIDLDVIFVPGEDPVMNPVGVKSLVELALCGVDPAIANAVWHATGKRLRELPLTPDKLLMKA